MTSNTPPPHSSQSRVEALDLLRGIAVVSVLVAHAKLESTTLPWVVSQSLNAVARFFSGVDLFFVLSGFLVSGLLLREYRRHGSIHAGRFLVRRGLKIYPSFYAFLLVSIGVSLAFGIWPHPTPANVTSELLFVQNYGVPLWSHTWSLAVEEHFYLCLVALLAWLAKPDRRNGLDSIPSVVGGVAVACLAMRIATAWLVPEFSFHVHLAPSHLRFDSLAFGMLLSYWYHRSPEVLLKLTRAHGGSYALTACLILAVCAVVPRHTFFGHTVIQSAQYVGHGILLLLAVADSRAQWLYRSRFGQALQATGRYSYSIYLWHMAVLIWSRTLMDHLLGPAEASRDLKVLAYAVLAVPVGVVAAWIVEMPVLALRDRFFPSRSDELRPVALAGPDGSSQASSG
jgi:peptidoglycan/LPS O-acetylase OafA/YrhL